MATQESGSSAWAATFQDILNIEESHGFDNKAVMGGLDKFVARFSDEMSDQAKEDKDFLLKESYGSMSVPVRVQWVAQWREALGGPTDPSSPQNPARATRQKKLAVNKAPSDKKTAYSAPPAETTVDVPVDRLRGGRHQVDRAP